MKIENLTEEQKALFPKYVEKWLKIGLCTKPTNKVRAEGFVRDAYKVVGLNEPKHIIWCKSPLSAIITAKLTNELLNNKEFVDKIKKQMNSNIEPTKIGASVWASVRDSVGASVGDSVGASVGASVRASVLDSVWDSVRDSVRASVWDSVRDSVWASVRASVQASVQASVWDSVGDSVGASVRVSVRVSVGTSVYSEENFGQQDANWLGFYNYFQEVLGLSKQVEKLIPLMQLAEEVNWFYPYQNFCFVSEKPEICKLKGNRIHSDFGPAIKYRDGFSVYALNGVRMPEHILNKPKEEVNSKDILKLDNAEQRMQAMKHKGLGHFFSELKTQQLDKKDGYELLLVDHNGEMCEYLKMVNPSTGEIHLEGCPPQTKTVNDALAWRNSLQYWINPMVLT